MGCIWCTTELNAKSYGLYYVNDKPVKLHNNINMCSELKE